MSGIRKVNVQTFADDNVLFCPTASGLRLLMETLQRFLQLNELVMNVDKTNIVVIHR